MTQEYRKLAKFYQGEAECPFQEDKQDQAMFWFYERKFEHDYYDTKLYPGMNLAAAFKAYQDKLFPALADKYGSMDDGSGFRDLYERLEP